MLNVQKYLRFGNSLESLTEKYGIIINEYDDIVVLNYNQIESPRFHPICDECRALILEKNSWNVVARSFNRFYNLGEGHDKGFGYIRLPSWPKTEDGDSEEPCIVPFTLDNSFPMSKLDGSLITAFFYNNQWNFSTRKMAFAEGQTTFGMTFAELIKSADNFANVEKLLNNFKFNWFLQASNQDSTHCSFVFELTSPANRIVTPYNRTTMNLLTVVHNETGMELLDPYSILKLIDEYELGNLGALAENAMHLESLVQIVNDMPAMEEGMVLVLKSECGKAPWRIKIKNPKLLAA